VAPWETGLKPYKVIFINSRMLFKHDVGEKFSFKTGHISAVGYSYGFSLS